MHQSDLQYNVLCKSNLQYNVLCRYIAVSPLSHIEILQQAQMEPLLQQPKSQSQEYQASNSKMIRVSSGHLSTKWHNGQLQITCLPCRCLRSCACKTLSDSQDVPQSEVTYICSAQACIWFSMHNDAPLYGRETANPGSIHNKTFPRPKSKTIGAHMSIKLQRALVLISVQVLMDCQLEQLQALSLAAQSFSQHLCFWSLP